jgi:phenylpropionate dioxygenase-like ring-hydroxylating dioxygenase large terminal subunit
VGWVGLCASDEVPPGGRVGVDVGDRELVVWRDAHGRLRVMDARCPHQWSHLGIEGAVEGDELVCTAHFWRFAADGTGTKRNVRGRRDPKAGVTAYPCREREGRIEADLGHAG